MKTIALFLMLFALSAPHLIAQHLIPQQATIEHNDEKRPCLKVTVDPPPKILKEAWQDYLKVEDVEEELKTTEERLKRVRKQLRKM